MVLKVGFIDPFISPEEIGNGLKKNKLKSVAIFQRHHLQNMDLEEKLKPYLFDEVSYLESNENIETIIAKIKPLEIDYIFNGFDNSTKLTDYLTNSLQLKAGNNIATSNYRYNKIFTQKILEQNGIATPNYLEINGDTLTSQEENVLEQWKFPIILKPANAGGTHGYIECNNLGEIKEKFKAKITDHYGQPINAYIAQEKLVGQEYAIDTFSLEGTHHIIHVRKYQKEYFAGAPIAKIADAVLPGDPIWSLLTNYIRQILKIIELDNGFCHAEIFATSKGLYVIDINPRLPGAKNSSCILAKETYGYSHIDVLSAGILKQKIFYRNYKFGRVIYLQNLIPRIINKVAIEKIKNLPSFKACILNQKKGTLLGLPRKLADTVAFVILGHQNWQQIEEDSERIFLLEMNQELF